jgi:hypothetical protein
MAILSDPDRLAVWIEFMRVVENINAGASGVSKADLRAAVTAIDQWNEDNQAAFNLAIPQPARGALSAKQKAALQMAIVARRWLVS